MDCILSASVDFSEDWKLRFATKPTNFSKITFSREETGVASLTSSDEPIELRGIRGIRSDGFGGKLGQGMFLLLHLHDPFFHSSRRFRVLFLNEHYERESSSSHAQPIVSFFKSSND